MKLNFRLLIFVAIFFTLVRCNAREIIVINYHQSQGERGELIYKVLTQQLAIPSQLITTFSEDSSCTPRRSAIIQLCISEDGEIHYPIYKKEILKQTIGQILGSKNEL